MSWKEYYRQNNHNFISQSHFLSRKHNHSTPRIDLHVHTTASDGAYTPKKIVQLAKEKEISFLAVTDHDTLKGLEEAESECHKYQLTFFPGIEFSTCVEKHDVHILGYNFDCNNEILLEMLTTLQEDRKVRIKKMVNKLSELGIPISIEDLTRKFGEENLGRPHIALVLKKLGLVQSMDEAFANWLNTGSPAFVPRYRLSPLTAIQLLLEAGGIPVLAHPGIDCPNGLIPSLIENGLRGIEVFHPKHTPEMEDYYLNMAVENKLLITGGSDFHGHEEKDLVQLGAMPVPLHSIKELLASHEL